MDRLVMETGIAGTGTEEGSSPRTSCLGQGLEDLWGDYTARRKSSQRSGTASRSTHSHKLVRAWLSSLSSNLC